MSDYHTIIETVFAQTTEQDRAFSKADLEQTALDLNLNVKNLADIRYHFDSRADLPVGDFAIIGRGKGLYEFVALSKPNLIRCPEDISEFDSIVDAPDRTPDLIKEYLGEDEQATLNRIGRADVLGNLLNLTQLVKLQDHCRTQISSGQIEVDEVCIGEDSAQNRYIVPIAAKGGQDRVSYGHIYNVGLFCKEKYPDLIPKICAIYKHRNGDIFVLVFSWDPNPDKIKIEAAHCLQLRSGNLPRPAQLKLL